MEMRARAVSVGVLASMVGLALLAPSAPAAPGTIKGTVAGPGTPDAGEGITAIRAVNAETGAIGATDYTAGRHDRWNLSVKPGPYAVGLAAIPFSGGKFIDRLLAFGGVKSRETEKLELKLKRKHGPTPPRRPLGDSREARQASETFPSPTRRSGSNDGTFSRRIPTWAS